MKVISYSIFGYERARVESCFDFNTYLRGIMLNLRFNRLIYPGWQTSLETDKVTYEAFESLFKPLVDSGVLIVNRNKNDAKLCEAMLWRLKPIYWADVEVLLCRDLDAIATYRERQAVEHWLSHDTKAFHAITDSVSHDLPLLGGMIGTRPYLFTSRTVAKTFEELMGMCKGIDLGVKGSDQTFLNQVLYPMFGQNGADSITQHYFNGHGNTFLSDFHTCTCPPPQGHRDNCPNNFKIDLPDELKESNSVCGHIGASGWYETATFRFLRKYWDRFDDLIKIEKQYPQIFYWNAQ